MDPLQFNPMMSHSTNHLVSSYLKHSSARSLTPHELLHEHQPVRTTAKAPTSWRLRLARHLDAWARRLDPEPKRSRRPVSK
jgi:hypothetical protein